MITAMQMMLDDLISKRETYENASMYHSVATLETSIELAEYLLEKEKEQMIVFGKKMQLVQHVSYDDDITYCFEPEEYFNKTYKNQAP
jgi:hypothetical protein